MEVRISSLGNLDKAIEEWKPTSVVSAIPIRGDFRSNLISKGVKHFDIPIDDIYNVMLMAYKNAILTVLNHVHGERLLFHCEHGKSRSAALAIIKIYSENPEDVEPWLEATPEAEPNPLLLLLGDEILDAEGDLWRRCQGRYKGFNLTPIL